MYILSGGGSLDSEGQIFYVYNREKTDWGQNKDYLAPGSTFHGLMLGGMPSTEINAIVLRAPETTLKGLSPKGDLGKKPTADNQTMVIYR